MNYQSRWEKLPIDILYQQILSLEDPSQILTFCHDPYINLKICQDKNGLIWKLLFQRDLSEFPILKEGETLMDRYMKAIRESKVLGTGVLLQFAAQNGYEKLVKEIPLSSLPEYLLLGTLIQAVTNGHLEIVKYLIGRGVNFRANAEQALKSAASNGHLEIVKYLIERGANIHVDADNVLFQTSLKGYLDMVKYLVGKGANIHANFEAALRYSALDGHLDIVKYLIEQGANIETALNYAYQYGDNELIKILTNIS